MKSLFFALIVSATLFAQDHGTNHGDDHSSGLINEMELGLELGDGVVEVAHLKTLKNTDTSILLLPGSIYLAGHTGHFDTMGYDRFSSFLLNVLNHHSNNIHGVQEYQVINSYGSWSGGVSLGNKSQKWCLKDRRYFTPNSTRETWGYTDINNKSCKYICVQ